VDLSRPMRFLWPSDPKCRDLGVAFLVQKDLKETATLSRGEHSENQSNPKSFYEVATLASAGGSGSTWTRYLIEGLSGVFTGSVYRKVKYF